MAQDEYINGYRLLGDGFKNDKSGTAKWGFAEKNGRQYFIKQFLSPSYPADDVEMSIEQIERKRKICYEFEAEKDMFYKTLYRCRTGNIISVSEFFRYGNKYYAVTEKVDAVPVPMDIIAGLGIDQKLLLAKIVLYCMSSIHDHGIVHADIKPDNILLKWTEGGVYTAKIIDFDSSFLEKNPPQIGDDFQGDMVYFAPESLLFLQEEEVEITRKIDSFAVGLLIHQYFTGELPYFDREKYDYAFEAVLDDCPPVVSDTIPKYLADKIRAMLDKDPEKRPEMNDVFDTIMDEERARFGLDDVAPPPDIYNTRFKGDLAKRIAVQPLEYTPVEFVDTKESGGNVYNDAGSNSGWHAAGDL